MAEKLTPRILPAKADEIAPWWIHKVRETIVRDKHELRAGFPLSIEVKGYIAFQPLNLPTNGTEFHSAADRDKVLGWLTGTIELPPLPQPATKAP